MCRKDRDTHTGKDRCAGCCHDAVGCSRRNTHAQNDAAEHGQEEGDEELVTRDSNNGIDHLICQTGHSDRTGDDTGDTAGRTDCDGALAARFKGIKEFFDCEAVAGIFVIADDGILYRTCGTVLLQIRDGPAVTAVQDTVRNSYNNSCYDGEGCCPLHRHHVVGYPDYQEDQRSQQINLADQLGEPGKLFGRNTGEAVLLCFQMDSDENTCEVEDCRKDRTDKDIRIRNADDICHQECRSAHDRGHDLAARGCRRLDSTCKLRFITGVFHHRDGDGTGCDRITYRRAADHTAESGGNDSDLCGTAGIAAGRAVCHVDKELGNTGSLKEGTEYDKYNDIFGTHIDRRRQNTGLCIEEISNQITKSSCDGRVCQAINDRIYDEEQRHDQDGPADTSAGHLEKCRNTDNSDNNLRHRKPRALLDDLFRTKCIVQEGTCSQHHSDNVIPGNIVGLLFSLFGRIHKESQQNDQSHEGSQTDFLQESGKQCHPDAEQRKADQNSLDNQGRFSGPYTYIGFSVIFSHDLLEVFLLQFVLPIFHILFTHGQYPLLISQQFPQSRRARQNILPHLRGRALRYRKLHSPQRAPLPWHSPS